MAVLVEKMAPDFKAQAVMPDGSFKEVSLAEFKDKKYVVLFFYPLDFTFVCPTEIIAFSEKAKEFEKIDVQILSCSVDSRFSHLAWYNLAINTSVLISGLVAPPIAGVIGIMATLLLAVGLRMLVAWIILKQK